MLIKNYWRISPTLRPLTDFTQDSSAFTVPAEIAARFRPGQGLLLGAWDDATELGRVTALGICRQLQGSQAQVQWREADITLKPSPAGRRFWRSKPCFCFAPDVVDRYGLADLFAEHFPEQDSLSFGNAPSGPSSARAPAASAAPTPGYVYLLKSPYGYKIGKTVNIRSRTRLFEVKLPFKFTLEHHAFFDDYSAAESQLHRRFASRRLEGEWFDLTEDDVRGIREMGRQGPAPSA